MVSRYELSADADQDIEGIYDYTVEAFGSSQAMVYLTGIEQVLSELVRNPELGRERPEIKPGLRSVVHEHHVVFYRVLSDRLRIVRILHNARDLRRLDLD